MTKSAFPYLYTPCAWGVYLWFFTVFSTFLLQTDAASVVKRQAGVSKMKHICIPGLLY